MKVAIVGAGWAGLACAVELADADVPLTLFEAGKVPGGRARSVPLGTETFDNGQHLLLGAYSTTLSLMKRVGADPDALLLRLPLAIQDSSGFALKLPALPAPLNLAWGLITARGPGVLDKLHTALAMATLQHQGYNLPEGDSVSQWLTKSQGNNAFAQHLWEPLCLAAMNTPAERASARVFAKVLRDSLGSRAPGATDLLLPKVPLGQLFPEPACRYLARKARQLDFSSRVKNIQRAPDGFRIGDETFSHVVIATAPQHLPGLLGAFPEITPPPQEYEPIATLYLRYPAHCRLPSPLFHLKGKVGQWLVDHAPLGRPGLLACVQSGAEPWAELPESALLAAIHQEISQLPGWQHQPPPQWHKLIREQRATFSCRPSLARATMKTAIPGLLLAGDHTWHDYPATLEGATRSGVAAAQEILGKH